jgi:hypothetical protein
MIVSTNTTLFPNCIPNYLDFPFTIIVHCMTYIDIDRINLMNEKEWSKKKGTSFIFLT